ncbi:MAG: prolipoprotein diacylglyceryl transferase [Acidobacteria bacterium]|nr:prolipoprotein diacylglyceryl transferase [Acidobacteriota bacterium]
MDASDAKTSGDPQVLGKVAYGAAFVIVLPALLVTWAAATADSVRLSPIESPELGVVLSGLGSALMVTGMWAIYVYGYGLPMNAFPPSRFVVESVYRYLSHPIYVGFSMLCFGIAILTGSASGFWLVAPLASLGCVVLVEGYEREATLKHFNRASSRPYLRLPSNDSSTPSLAERISTFVLAIGPVIVFNLVSDRIADNLGPAYIVSGDQLVIPSGWSALLIIAGILLIFAVPLLAATTRQLRRFTLAAIFATGVAAILFLAFPYSRPLPADGAQVTGWALDLTGRSVAALALNLALIFSSVFTLVDRERMPWIVSYAFTLLIVAAGLAVGVYGAIEILAGAGIYAIGANRSMLWRFIRRGTERIANSWTEWRFGPVRVISHGFFAAAGAFVSLSVIGVLAGAAYVPFVMMITFLAITISSLSAQWIEGSPRLLRPYGWYGGVVGAFAGALIAYLFGANTWLIIAAFCVGAPFVQAAGRLRCLVQGCCHGRPAPASIGIRYSHELSRVCRIADMKDKPLHPTQLYSIAYNFLVAIVLLRLWFAESSLGLIVGLYYILTGMGRFVEESYRGEPQTPMFAGLRLYQVFAVISLVGGIGATMIRNTGNATPPDFNWEAIVAAAIFGVFVCIAFGVDFPDSTRRFARLT